MAARRARRRARTRLALEVANRTGRRLPGARAWGGLARLALAGRGLLTRPALLSVAVVAAREMRRLNRRFRGGRGLTDVLAFPSGERDPETGRLDLGEVVVCLEAAEREARRRGGGAAGELALYVLHGILHLAGYNDMRPEDRRRMEREQDRLLARWERAPQGKAAARRPRSRGAGPRAGGGAPPGRGA